MTDAFLFDLMRQGLWAAIMASLPILSIALITGLAIGLVQALTSIQEMTLTFVPKLAAIAATFWFSMEFMSANFVDLWREVLTPLIAAPPTP